MQMHGLDVQTAARYGLPIIYIVLNNNALGNVWLRAHQYGQLPSALTTIPDHDWAGFDRALGAQGLTVEDPAALGATFGKSLERCEKSEKSAMKARFPLRWPKKSRTGF